MEGWARELAAQNLALFEGWEATTPVRVNLGPPQLAGRNPPPELLERGRFRGGQERLAVCSQLGLDPNQIG